MIRRTGCRWRRRPPALSPRQRTPRVDCAVGVLHQHRGALHLQVAGVASDVDDRLFHRRNGFFEVGDIRTPGNPSGSNLLNRRATLVLTVPLIQMGTPPGCNGFGIWWMPSKVSSGEP